MHSKQKFVIEGMKQAGLVLGAFLLLGVVGWCVAIKGAIGQAVLWIIAFICGPIPTILLRCDITDKQLQILWIAFILPYWICLGAVVGFAEHKLCANCDCTSPPKKTSKKMRQFIIMVAFFLGLLAIPSMPSAVTGGPSMEGGIVNNLRQLDAAKQQLALEKNLSDDYVPTTTELAPFLSRNGKDIPHIGEERYVINPIGKKPYAVLDSDWRIRRRGWQQGYTITNGTVWRIQ